MDDVRGIAGQRQPLADEGARQRISQWVYATRANDFDLAELEPEPALELRVEEIVGKRNDCLRSCRLLGPHDRRAATFERQDRKRPGGKKMLARPPGMIAFGRHIGD